MILPPGYRTLARPLPRLAPPAPWWRLAAWWARGGKRRLLEARARRELCRAFLDKSWSERCVIASELADFGVSAWDLSDAALREEGEVALSNMNYRRRDGCG